MMAKPAKLLAILLAAAVAGGSARRALWLNDAAPAPAAPPQVIYLPTPASPPTQVYDVRAARVAPHLSRCFRDDRRPDLGRVAMTFRPQLLAAPTPVPQQPAPAAAAAGPVVAQVSVRPCPARRARPPRPPAPTHRDLAPTARARAGHGRRPACPGAGTATAAIAGRRHARAGRAADHHHHPRTSASASAAEVPAPLIPGLPQTRLRRPQQLRRRGGSAACVLCVRWCVNLAPTEHAPAVWLPGSAFLGREHLPTRLEDLQKGRMSRQKQAEKPRVANVRSPLLLLLLLRSPSPPKPPPPCPPRIPASLI